MINTDDFNLLTLSELFDSMALIQHVNFPTHEHGHSLDLNVTRIWEGIISYLPFPDRFLSDHCAVLCNLKAPKPQISRKEISYYFLVKV